MPHNTVVPKKDFAEVAALPRLGAVGARASPPPRHRAKSRPHAHRNSWRERGGAYPTPLAATLAALRLSLKPIRRSVPARRFFGGQSCNFDAMHLGQKKKCKLQLQLELSKCPIGVLGTSWSALAAAAAHFSFRHTLRITLSHIHARPRAGPARRAASVACSQAVASGSPATVSCETWPGRSSIHLGLHAICICIRAIALAFGVHVDQLRDLSQFGWRYLGAAEAAAPSPPPPTPTVRGSYIWYNRPSHAADPACPPSSQIVRFRSRPAGDLPAAI